MRSTRRGRLLIVEDEQIVCEVLESMFSGRHEIQVIGNGATVRERFKPGTYDVALIDLGLPGIPGDEVAEHIRGTDPLISTILITGWKLKQNDDRLSAFDFSLKKPFDDLSQVEDVVAQAIDLHDIRAQQLSGRSIKRGGS